MVVARAQPQGDIGIVLLGIGPRAYGYGFWLRLRLGKARLGPKALKGQQPPSVLGLRLYGPIGPIVSYRSYSLIVTSDPGPLFDLLICRTMHPRKSASQQCASLAKGRRARTSVSRKPWVQSQAPGFKAFDILGI